jgi:hypothetical protein
MTIRRSFLAALLVAFVLAPVPAQQKSNERKQNGPDVFTQVRRVVAFGDIHADRPVLEALLRQAGLIGPNNTNWTGGDTHLVLAGDFLDRGPSSGAVLDLLMALEAQAQRAGGRVHAVIGNHEAMNIYGDLRYVSPEDFAWYRDKDSEKRREAQMQAVLRQLKLNGRAPADEAAWRAQFLSEIPLGWVEQRLAFTPAGKYGKWLLKQNAIVRINDAIYLHGGISQKYVTYTIQEINDRVRAELSGDPLNLRGGICQDDEGPLWYRGLALAAEDDEQTAALVNRILEAQQVKHVVIGHTPQPAILPRFGGKVIVIDVGVSRLLDGPPAFLLVEDGKYWAVHRGRKLDLPVDGGPVNEYLNAAALLEPVTSRLRTLVERLGPSTQR